MNKIKSTLLLFCVFLMSQNNLFCDNWTTVFTAIANNNDPVKAARYILSKPRLPLYKFTNIYPETAERNATAYYLGYWIGSNHMMSKAQVEAAANAIISGIDPYAPNE